MSGLKDGPDSEPRRPPMPRPGTVLSVLSALLLAATAIDGRRSRTNGDALALKTPWVTLLWSSAAGKVELRGEVERRVVASAGPAWDLTRRQLNRSGPVLPPDNLHLRGGGLVDRRLLGITYQSGALLTKFAALAVPHAWLVALLAVLPVRWVFVRARRSHYLRLRGLCGACGYDLRASVGKCPECGEAIVN